MTSSFTRLLTVACLVASSLSILAADNKSAAASRLSQESSPQPGEKTDESVPREFLGFADVSEFRGVIDDPAGSVDVRADNRTDAAIIAKVKTGEQVSFDCKEGNRDRT
jgi:hypothetical protein